MNFYFVYITCADQAEAQSIGQTLVEERLAACVNILPAMQSIYRWQGKLESANETVLIAKTSSEKFEDLKNKVLSMHSYDCPCVVALPIQEGSAAYLSWLQASLR